MDCLRCGAPTEGKALCPACLAAGRVNKPEHYTPPAPDRGPEVRLLLRCTLAVVAVLVVVFGNTLSRTLNPVQLPALAMATSGGTERALVPCGGAERCLIVYLAPWCPSCRRSVELVRELRALAGTRGAVRIVAGGDSRAALDAFAAEIGGEVFIDSDSAFPAAVGFSSVPYWVLVNAEGTVLDESAGFRVSGRSAGEQARSFVENGLASHAEYFSSR